jgi:hypothetical protein
VGENQWVGRRRPILAQERLRWLDATARELDDVEDRRDARQPDPQGMGTRQRGIAANVG